MDELSLQLRRKIAEAVRASDITQTEAWASLTGLSAGVTIESVETFEDEIQLAGETFAGALLLHVTLRFEDESGPILASESLPGSFEGHLTDGVPNIERMLVDTSAVFA